MHKKKKTVSSYAKLFTTVTANLDWRECHIISLAIIRQNFHLKITGKSTLKASSSKYEMSLFLMVSSGSEL